MNKELYDKLICAALLLIGMQKEDEKIAKTKGEIDNLNYQLIKAKENTKSKPRGYIAKKVWGIILTSVFGLNYFIFTIGILSADHALELKDTIPPFIPITGFTIIGILLLISARKKRLKHQAKCIKEYEELQKTTAEKIEELNNEIEYISEKKEIFYSLHKDVIEFLPQKYHTLDAVGFMLESVQNLRADTLTDVINLYEDEIRWRKTQTAIAQQNLIRENYARQLNNIMSQIEKNQQDLHSDLQNIQIMQMYNTFK